MQDRVLSHDKVTVHFNTAVDDAYPDGKGALAGLHTKDTKSGQDFLHSLRSHSSALQQICFDALASQSSSIHA